MRVHILTTLLSHSDHGIMPDETGNEGQSAGPQVLYHSWHECPSQCLFKCSASRCVLRLVAMRDDDIRNPLLCKANGEETATRKVQYSNISVRWCPKIIHIVSTTRFLVNAFTWVCLSTTCFSFCLFFVYSSWRERAAVSSMLELVFYNATRHRQNWRIASCYQFIVYLFIF